MLNITQTTVLIFLKRFTRTLPIFAWVHFYAPASGVNYFEDLDEDIEDDDEKENDDSDEDKCDSNDGDDDCCGGCD